VAEGFKLTDEVTLAGFCVDAPSEEVGTELMQPAAGYPLAFLVGCYCPRHGD
jgi:hypothetical protein